MKKIKIVIVLSIVFAGHLSIKQLSADVDEPGTVQVGAKCGPRTYRSDPKEICAPGLYCQGWDITGKPGTCVKGCWGPDKFNCPLNSYCDSPTGAGKCISGCFNDKNCHDGQICSNKKCVAGSLVQYYVNMGPNAPTEYEKIDGQEFLAALYSPGEEVPSWVRGGLQWFGTNVLSMLKQGPQWIMHFIDSVPKFVKDYKIDMSDFTPDNPEKYSTFNDFFIRQLAQKVRKIDERPNVVTSVADSKLRVLPNVSAGDDAKFFIKQQPFNLTQFLGDKKLANQYEGGTLLVFRLAPTDYHRFHFPFDCQASKSVPLDSLLGIVGAKYESVSPVAFRTGIWPLSENKRKYITLKSDEFGEVIMMAVGAAMVGSIQFTYTPDNNVKKGDEAGYFQYGGSTICLLFKKGMIDVPNILLTRSKMDPNTKTKEVTVKGHKETITISDYKPYETAMRVGQGVAVKSGQPDTDATLKSLSTKEYVTFLDKKNKNLTLNLNGTDIPFAWNVYSEN